MIKYNYPYLESRSCVWQVVANYIQSYLGKINRQPRLIVELASGYCDLINNLRAQRKICYDYNSKLAKFASPDVDFRCKDITSLRQPNEKDVDLIIASNFIEHLDLAQIQNLLQFAHSSLADNGILILIQPNYRLCKEQYFIDPTHISTWDDENLPALLRSNRFKPILVKPKFLPLTFKSRLPKWPTLVKAYLLSPLKPLAGQMLICAERS